MQYPNKLLIMGALYYYSLVFNHYPVKYKSYQKNEKKRKKKQNPQSKYVINWQLVQKLTTRLETNIVFQQKYSSLLMAASNNTIAKYRDSNIYEDLPFLAFNSTNYSK